jgi:4-methylaminobutanoate oxidase (formaldehyde-forming)
VAENTHGAYAHTFGRSIGMCYLECEGGISDDWIKQGEYAINVAGKEYPITIHLEPLYDPKSTRVRM